MQYLESHQNLSFHTWMYFMTVSISSVGYGDITAESDIGRFATMAMISFAIISVPQMTNGLIEKMSRQSYYARTKYLPRTGNSIHVLVCGNMISTSLTEFLDELFHDDHETLCYGALHCVILQPHIPTFEMRALLRDPRYGSSITYLEGSPLSDNDLKRADAINASAIFIMTNKFSLNPDEEDSKTILEQFSIQKYIRLHSSSLSTPLFCIQLIRPENKRHLVSIEKRYAGSNGNQTAVNEEGGGSVGGGGGGSSMLHREIQHHGEDNLVICLNEIKMGVIAKAIVFPVWFIILLFAFMLLTVCFLFFSCFFLSLSLISFSSLSFHSCC
jgi:uncharacterized membrane protein YgcG